jgi:putative ABC transport system permease protein
VHRVALALRGLWWRRGLTAAVLAVAVVTTTSAALGPLYARAAAESILQDHLTSAGYTTGLRYVAQVDVGAKGAYARLSAQVPKAGAINGYDTVIPGLYTASGVGASPADGSGEVATHLVWRQGACQHLVIVSGRCPTGPNEGLISQRTVDAKIYRWRLGTRIDVGPLTLGDQASSGAAPTPPPIRIVGTYRPIDTADPFWFAQDYFDGRASTTPNGPDTVDSVFVTESEFLSLPAQSYAEADFDYPLTAGAVRIANVPAERAAVNQVLAAHPADSPIAVQSGLPGVLTAAAHERHLVDVGTLLVTLQLALLAWLVLFQVVSDAIEARGNEIAMAKLRGHSPAATVRFGLGEPLALLLAAIPLGLLLALAVTRIFAAAVFVPGVPIVLTWAPVLTSLVAFAGGLIAAVLAGQRTLTRSVLDQWRRTTRSPGHGRLSILMDAVLAAAAGAGLVVLRGHHPSGASNDTAALLAPGLLVFAVAVIGVRLLPLVCRWLAGWTRGSRRVGLFLASRQVSRRPVGLRLAALLAVAVGLATFAVAGESVAQTNRSARAKAELGAHRVISIQYENGHDPVAAVRRADPDGTWAMAAATWLPDGGDSVAGTVLAVDSSRLAAVGYPAAGGPSPAELAALVGAASVPEIILRAPQLRVHVTASGLVAGASPAVQVNLRTPAQPFINVESGRLDTGSHVYSVALPCAAGCTFTGLTWYRPFGVTGPISGTAVVTGIDIGDGTTWTPLNAYLTRPGAWRANSPQGQASDRVSATAAGVQDTFASQNGGYGGIAYSYVPSPIPAVATPRAIVTGYGRPPIPEVIDGLQSVATFHIAAYAQVLPALLDNGVLMDTTFVQTELPAFAGEANWQVWLSPSAPQDAVARLTAAGLQLQSAQSEHARVIVLGRQGPALSLLLLLACAVAGAVLAVGGTAISISASSRRRSYEIAALQAVGVSRRSLLRASVLEQLLLLGTAVVLGVPTGLLAARLAMPVIPEFADTTPIALRYTPQVLPTLLFAAAFVVLLTATALLAAGALMRIAVPSRLREAEG